MFDPTAFENMKVVLEGVFYDKDLSGEIVIFDRNDMINTAKLSRSYDLSFRLMKSLGQEVSCKLIMNAGFKNLAAELFSSEELHHLAGCEITIEYYYHHVIDESISIKAEDVLRKIWGEDRIIRQKVCYETSKPRQKALYTAYVSFDRIIREDQIEDLSEMADFMITTLAKLEKVVKEK